MGLFSRRRQAVAVATRVWQPCAGVLGNEWYVAPAAEMYDDGCAGDACGAEFILDGVPLSTIRVWAYPVPSGPHLTAPYEIGYRIEYRAFAEDGTEPWLGALYANDGPDAGKYNDLDAASAACRIVAQALAGTVRTEDSPDPLGCFDWDGAPW